MWRHQGRASHVTGVTNFWGQTGSAVTWLFGRSLTEGVPRFLRNFPVFLLWLAPDRDISGRLPVWGLLCLINTNHVTRILGLYYLDADWTIIPNQTKEDSRRIKLKKNRRFSNKCWKRLLISVTDNKMVVDKIDPDENQPKNLCLILLQQNEQEKWKFWKPSN